MTDIYGNLYQFAPNAQEWVDVWGLKNNSQLLGEAITKSTRWSSRQAHHKILVEVFNNSPLLQRLEKQGLSILNGKGNGIMLPESLSKGLPVLNIRSIIEDITKQLWK